MIKGLMYQGLIISVETKRVKEKSVLINIFTAKKIHSLYYSINHYDKINSTGADVIYDYTIHGWKVSRINLLRRQSKKKI